LISNYHVVKDAAVLCWFIDLVGRAVLCPPPPANERILVHHDGAHGVTRPTFLLSRVSCISWLITVIEI
jgi:hypothetical protein